MASDCTDDACTRCYEPFMLAISTDADDAIGLQLDVSQGWDDVERLIAALRAARSGPVPLAR